MTTGKRLFAASGTDVGKAHGADIAKSNAKGASVAAKINAKVRPFGNWVRTIRLATDLSVYFLHRLRS